MFIFILSSLVQAFLAQSQSCEVLIPHTPPVCYSGYDKVFYLQFAPYLPLPGSSWTDDLQLYMPTLEPQKSTSLHCHHDQSFSEGTHDLTNFDGKAKYFSWISSKYRLPIFASMFAPACGDDCPVETGRGCSKFQTCDISNVTHYDYTDSLMDRGHLVPNSALGIWYNTSASTFSMCNINPQSKRLNEDDWVQLEHWIGCLGKHRQFYVHTGPIFNKTSAFDYCLCSGNSAGIMSCDECDVGTPVPIPSGFWKILVTPAPDYMAYTWIYTKAQEKCAANVTDADCSPGDVIQTVDDAFDPNGLEAIQSLVNFRFPPYFTQATSLDDLKAQTECSYLKHTIQY